MQRSHQDERKVQRRQAGEGDEAHRESHERMRQNRSLCVLGARHGRLEETALFEVPVAICARQRVRSGCRASVRLTYLLVMYLKCPVSSPGVVERAGGAFGAEETRFNPVFQQINQIETVDQLTTGPSTDVDKRVP